MQVAETLQLGHGEEGEVVGGAVLPSFDAKSIIRYVPISTPNTIVEIIHGRVEAVRGRLPLIEFVLAVRAVRAKAMHDPCVS